MVSAQRLLTRLQVTLLYLIENGGPFSNAHIRPNISTFMLPDDSQVSPCPCCTFLLQEKLRKIDNDRVSVEHMYIYFRVSTVDIGAQAVLERGHHLENNAAPVPL